MDKKNPLRPWDKEKKIQGGRSKSNYHLYNSHKWRTDRRHHLDQFPLCLHCQASGIVKAATVSDHVVPVNQGGDVWDWSNRQPLCKQHHNQKSGRERWG